MTKTASVPYHRLSFFNKFNKHLYWTVIIGILSVELKFHKNECYGNWDCVREYEFLLAQRIRQGRVAERSRHNTHVIQRDINRCHHILDKVHPYWHTQLIIRDSYTQLISYSHNSRLTWALQLELHITFPQKKLNKKYCIIMERIVFSILHLNHHISWCI